MKKHELKIWPSYFDAVASGIKTFEWRKNDRDFAVGDQLVLREWNPALATGVCGQLYAYTGRELTATVCYKAEGVFGIPEGWCILGLTNVGRSEESK